MAYIPPHKRHQSKDGDRSAPTPTPIPASLSPRFKGTLNIAPGGGRKAQIGARRIAYASDSVFRWWPVGAASNKDPIPASFRLEPFDCEIVERMKGKKPLVLLGGGGLEAGAAEGQDIPPWVSIAKRLVPDLISAAVSARNDLKRDEDEEGKLSFVARPGKNLFHGDSSVCLDYIRKAAFSSPYFTKTPRKTFYTNVPNAYMENVKTLVAPKIGLTFHSEKEYYILKVSDKRRPDLTIICKCKVVEGRQLELYKIEGNLVRHLVEDISCLYKDLDLRLLLSTKRKIKNDENEAINELVRCAVIDPEAKGGLTWPLGRQPAADRFSVIGMWRTKCVALKNNAMRLMLRHADRYDFMSSIGEVSAEATLKLTEIAGLLKEGDMETIPLEAKVQEAVKLLWDHLLRCVDPTST